MISLYGWRERGEVWPSKNKLAPDGEKDRAGAAAGLASVTAPGALSKILLSWVSPLWKSLEEELTGQGHSRKETQSVQRHCMTGTAAFVRFRQGLTGSEGWTLNLNSKASSDGFKGVLCLLSGGTSWVTGVRQDLYTKNSLAMLADPFFLHLSHCKLVEVKEGYLVASKSQFTEYKWIRWELCEMPHK